MSVSIPTALRDSATHVLVEPGENLDDDALAITDDVEHHLVRVLRLKSGETITATDGNGVWREYSVAVNGSSLIASATGPVRAIERFDPLVTIATAIPKGDRVDWLVQKCTELGADRIVFLHAERSVVRWKPERAAKQVVRLQRVADEALRQSRRVWRVEVETPRDAADLLGDMVIAEPGGRRLAATDATIGIGPEGGWTPTEVDRAADEVHLADRILRTETAAIAAITLSQSLRD